METNAQTHQDTFVRLMLNFTRNGTFVDVGCSVPIAVECHYNNTYLLEKADGWRGLSLDIEDVGGIWAASDRACDGFVRGDALTQDYAALFAAHNLTNPIDYLTLDIEGDGLRFAALQKVMAAGVEFKLITIEHDAYRGYETTERAPQRQLLQALGYVLLCGNISHNNCAYEDWWVNPRHIAPALYQPLQTHDCDHATFIAQVAAQCAEFYTL